ncbi:MAG: hypothetical protein COU85_01830 [Candidatus Portnoybacteria bacterium CG10_big_fil_rev_8_21_14_0_10_44_7]|uniref:Uncharacterized protein n=1 Tax=Candidatus Portnoybacteria bacterium CG10_big_fil_rev_8_21_14_0_10_44_7 TaxID=1974816 RepID=A0A2M8KIP6_9BACT|nr:MAG: hypothetical protein COU85_01830 [Candidatus Portnoybacteria bacterium CG10_big_fil_rev_8_21_14_0_10_44_7]
MIAYHFTSKRVIEKIRKDGYLRPRTPLFLMRNINGFYKEGKINLKDYKNLKNFAKKLPRKKFIVAIPKSRLPDWAKSGLIKDIEVFLRYNYLLELEIPDNCVIYVREHIYSSPQEVKNKYKQQMYQNVPEPHKTTIWMKYFRSTRVIKDESGLKNMKVPEMWIGCQIPLNMIKVNKMNILNKFYSYSTSSTSQKLKKCHGA